MEYAAALTKVMEAGRLGDYPEPDPPGDLGDPLTQDEINFIKKLKKEIEERFTPVT